MNYIEQITNQLNSELRSALLDAIQKGSIRNDFDSNLSDEYVTIFVNLSSGNSSRKKKSLSKYAKTHPEVEVSYSRERTFDYATLVEKSKKPTLHENITLSRLSTIYIELLKPEWYVDVTNHILSWSRRLFYAVSAIYSEKYSITLMRLPFEIYLANPTEMFISKLPNFQDLCFVSDKNHKKCIDNDEFIRQQATTLEELYASPFFNR